MKIAAGMKIIAEGWVRKPKGFRVRYERITDGETVTEYSPPLADAHMDSDVTTWRYAWKLARATTADSGTEETFYNVTVVDDTDTPVVYYATGRPEIFNPKS